MEKRDEIREELFEIDTNEFSDFVSDLWEHQGYDIEDADGRRATFKAVKGGGFLRSSTTELIQPLYREGYKVDKSDVNRVLDLRWGDDIDEIVVVTTTEFTDGARKQEKREEVTVLNGEELADLIIDEGAERVLSRYTPNGSLLKGLVELFVILPLRIAWFIVALPFKLLFGPENQETAHEE
ncbi:restriction endonuclease [Natronorubrum texcoconense]|uniref:Restriction endonuclease n=1 Tax=Natronorubrum texcoconense TaxID=1095776 RepID=A0A1G8VGX4_9EURY|nr:restriction endonuclease [Natronorubrum texcoconense]SDJ65298.1 Restriction endonuclease [Natronorubrum texcoconense]